MAHTIRQSALRRLGVGSDLGTQYRPGLTRIVAMCLACIAAASVAAVLATGGLVQDAHAQQHGPLTLTPLGSLSDDGNLKLNGAEDVVTFTTGDKIYAVVAAHYDNGIQIVDVTDPRSPTAAGSIELGEPYGVDVFEVNGTTYAAVVGDYNVVVLVDLTDPTSPERAGHLSDKADLLLDRSHAVAAFRVNERAYLAVPSYDESGLQIVNVTDPDNPSAAGNLADTGATKLSGPFNVAVFERGGKTYAAVPSSPDDSFQLVNISNPQNPTPAGKISENQAPFWLQLDGARSVAVYERDGKTYAVVGGYFDDGISIFDVSNPDSPKHLRALSDISSWRLAGPAGLDAFRIGVYSYVAVVGDEDAIQIVDVTNPRSPTNAGILADGGDRRLSNTHDVDIFTRKTATGTAYYAAVTSNQEDAISIVRLQHPDNVQPLYESATLDERTRKMTITFDETIDVSETDLSGLYVSDSGQTDTVQLTDAALDPSSSDSATLSLTLTLPQMEQVIPMDTPQLDIDAGAVSDLAANTVPASPDSPITISTEAVPPAIVSAVFEGNTMTVTFDREVQNVDLESVMLVSDGRDRFGIDIPDVQGTALDIGGVSDSNADLIRQMFNPILTVSAGDFVDNFGAQNARQRVPVTVVGGIPPGDTTPPTMVSATFDRNDNGLTVEFDEPVEQSPGATVLFGLGDTVFIHSPGHSIISANSSVATMTVDQDIMDALDSHTLLSVASSVFADLAGNPTSVHSVQHSVIEDTTPPVISLRGQQSVAVELGGTYAEQGATVSDNNPAYAATEATVGGDTVDTSAAGTYTVTYTAPPDGSGNLPYAVERIVTVRDTTKPVISLNGDRGVTVELNGTYAEQGATVSDNDPAYAATEATVGGDAVDTYTAGTYTVTYTAPADAAGNEPDPVFRTVSVRDPAPSFASAALEMDTGSMTITFDETVDISATSLTRLYVSDTGRTDQVHLAGAALDRAAPDSDTVSLTLTRSHLDQIARMTTPQLDMAAGAVSDPDGNAVHATADGPITVTGTVDTGDTGDTDDGDQRQPAIRTSGGGGGGGSGRTSVGSGTGTDTVDVRITSILWDCSEGIIGVTAGPYSDDLSVSVRTMQYGLIQAAPEGAASSDGYAVFSTPMHESEQYIGAEAVLFSGRSFATDSQSINVDSCTGERTYVTDLGGADAADGPVQQATGGSEPEPASAGSEPAQQAGQPDPEPAAPPVQQDQPDPEPAPDTATVQPAAQPAPREEPPEDGSEPASAEPEAQPVQQDQPDQEQAPEPTSIAPGTPPVQQADQPGGGCLIATAAYGTEMAPQIQNLREIRDTTLLSTQSGSSFAAGFNSAYYSFSPAIADMQRESPALRDAVRVLITPMVSTLSIMSLAEEGSEASVLALGASVILLNLGMYVAAPAVAGIVVAGRIRQGV